MTPALCAAWRASANCLMMASALSEENVPWRFRCWASVFPLKEFHRQEAGDSMVFIGGGLFMLREIVNAAYVWVGDPASHLDLVLEKVQHTFVGCDLRIGSSLTRHEPSSWRSSAA